MTSSLKYAVLLSFFLFPFSLFLLSSPAQISKLSTSEAAQQSDDVSRFDPAAAATVRGQVTWTGDLPQVNHFEGRSLSGFSLIPRAEKQQNNPNAPVIDPRSRGVGNAVVFLRGVDPQRARPWDHAPVRVEHRGRQLHVVQGNVDSPFGFVRRGEAVEMISKEEAFHALQARGSAFFSLMFPDPDLPLSRRLDEQGLVELSSNAGYFWMRAYLFVADHPYYARTDAQGRFVLPQVPPGRYEVVCWMPNWHKASHERNPETGLITRVRFAPPAEKAQTVTVGEKETREVRFLMAEKDFER